MESRWFQGMSWLWGGQPATNRLSSPDLRHLRAQAWDAEPSTFDRGSWKGLREGLEIVAISCYKT